MKKNIDKKLELKKLTVANLNEKQLEELRGGKPPRSDEFTCPRNNCTLGC